VTTDQAAGTVHELGKSLKSRHVAMISIGGIIGAGLFVGSSAAIATVGPGIIVSYTLAGLVVLMVMRMLGEMAVAYPHIGAFTEFARLGLGNWAGFTNGWLYWYFWAIVAAIEAIAGAKILHDWVPELPIWVIGWGLLAMMTAVNLMSTGSYGEFEFWFASLKVAAIIAFILVGLVFVLGHNPMDHVANLTRDGGFAPFGTAAVLSGVVTVIFALCGAEIATIAAAESPEPARTIANMTGSVVLRILLFYIGSISLILMIIPWRQIHSGDSPFAVALESMNVPAAAFAMKIVVLTAVLSCLNSAIYVCSRVMFTLSARGDAPKVLVKLNGRKVPVRAILFCSLFGYVAIAASVVSPEKVFAFLVNASGAIMLIVYLITALAQIRLRRHLESTAPDRLGVRVWLFPATSYLAVAAMVAVVIAMIITPARAVEAWSSLVVVAVVLALYAVFRMGRGGKLDI
jgi:gamma-aminobutyrate permease